MSVKLILTFLFSYPVNKFAKREARTIESTAEGGAKGVRRTTYSQADS
jgi:hypothetical protein